MLLQIVKICARNVTLVVLEIFPLRAGLSIRYITLSGFLRCRFRTLYWSGRTLSCSLTIWSPSFASGDKSARGRARGSEDVTLVREDGQWVRGYIPFYFCLLEERTFCLLSLLYLTGGTDKTALLPLQIHSEGATHQFSPEVVVEPGVFMFRIFRQDRYNAYINIGLDRLRRPWKDHKHSISSFVNSNTGYGESEHITIGNPSLLTSA